MILIHCTDTEQLYSYSEYSRLENLEFHRSLCSVCKVQFIDFLFQNNHGISFVLLIHIGGL